MENLRLLIGQQIKELGARVVYMPLKQKGKAIIPLKLVIVNDQLTKEEQEQVILHELEHIRQGHYSSKIESPVSKLKKEAQAEHGRIKVDVGHYITNTPQEYWNSFNFINYFGIAPEHENYVNDQFQNLLNNREK